MPDYRLILEFAGESEPELESTRFVCPIYKRELRCVRGKLSLASPGLGTFQWTTAVIAFATAILKAKVAKSHAIAEGNWFGVAGISGRNGSLAASLDYAISKQPNWLRDIFGIDSEGIPLAKRAFIRRNTEGKRDLPTSVAVNPAFLAPQLIRVLWNGRDVADDILLSLVERFEARVRGGDERAIIEPTTSQGDLEFSFECLRVPMSDESGGVEQSTVCIDDLALHVIALFPSATFDEVSHRLTCHLKQVIRRDALQAAIGRLCGQGILKERSGQFLVNPFWLQPRLGVISAIRSLAEVTPSDEQVTGRSALNVSNAPLCAAIHFPTIAAYDRFMPLLLDQIIVDFAVGREMLWQLRHPWWPFVRRHRETGVASYATRFDRIRYISKSTSPLDRWVKGFYRELQIEGSLGRTSVFRGDIWVCDEVIVFQYLAPDVEDEIDRFFCSSSTPDSFDAVQFQRDIFYSPMPAVIRVMVAPGLSKIFRQAFAIRNHRRVINE
jgi:hypothetical protein